MLSLVLTQSPAGVVLPVVSAVLAIEGLPGEREYAKPVGATRVKYIEALEDNTHVIYPAIAIFVLVLIVLGILQAWRTDDMSGELKAELKREVIRELRVNPHGMTVEALGKALKLQPLKLLKVLEEMALAGITESRTDTRRHTTWRVKGTMES